jgi:uncharacterized membrane protein HdeD (DUF308 family)
MNHIENLSDNIIIGLIVFIILFLIKGILSLTNKLKLNINLFKNKSTYDIIKESLDTILDTILFLFAIFILFFRKDNSILVIILAIMFLLKGFFQYFLDLKLYTYTNIDNAVIENITKIKNVNSIITDTIIFFASFYMIKTIFL